MLSMCLIYWESAELIFSCHIGISGNNSKGLLRKSWKENCFEQFYDTLMLSTKGVEL